MSGEKKQWHKREFFCEDCKIVCRPVAVRTKAKPGKPLEETYELECGHEVTEAPQ